VLHIPLRLQRGENVDVGCNWRVFIRKGVEVVEFARSAEVEEGPGVAVAVSDVGVGSLEDGDVADEEGTCGALLCKILW